MNTVDITALATELRKLAAAGPYRITWVEGKFTVEIFNGDVAEKSGTGSDPRFSVAYQVAVNRFGGMANTADFSGAQ